MHLCTMYLVKSSSTKTQKVNEATTTALDGSSPNDQAPQSTSNSRLKIKVATTNWVSSKGEINKVNARLIKNTLKSARDEVEKKTLRSKILRKAWRIVNFLEISSQKKAIPKAAIKYPMNSRFLGSKKCSNTLMPKSKTCTAMIPYFDT